MKNHYKNVLSLLLILILSSNFFLAQKKATLSSTVLKSQTNGHFIVPNETNGTFATTVYTFGDITIFSYFDNTNISIYDAANNLQSTKTLNLDSTFTFNYGSGVFRIVGNKTYTVLVGDAINHTVNGFFAIDEAGRGVSTKLDTWMSSSYDNYDDFIIFAYQDNTGFTVKNLRTGILIAAGTINAGQHYSFSDAGNIPYSTPLQVSATKPVSVLSYTDQDYYVPSSNGSFIGTLFYGYSAYNGLWENSITVTSYSDNNNVTVKNTLTGETISSYTLQKGQVHTDGITSRTFWTVTSSGPVSTANIPFSGWDGFYYYMTRAIDETGKGFGKLFYVPTIQSDIHIFSFDNNNSVTITKLGQYDAFPYSNPTIVWNGTLNEGEYYHFSSEYGKYVYKVESSGFVSVLQSNGGAGADFMPLAYSLDYPDLAVSSSDIVFSKTDSEINAGDKITITVTVHNYGNIAANNIIVTAFDGDPDAGGNAPPIGSGSIANIAAGSTGIFAFDYTVPFNPEYRTIVVKVDPANVIVESNESNNKAYRSIKPSIELLPPLAITVTAPSSLSLQNGNITPNPFNVQLDIFNTGTVTAGNVVATLELFEGLTLASGNLIQTVGNIAANSSATITFSILANPNISGFNRYKITITSTNANTKIINRAVNVPDAIPPSTPTNLTIQLSGGNCVSLNWNVNSESDLAGYYIYYGTDGVNWNGTGATQGDSPILVIGQNNFEICGLSAGTYYFAIKAFDTSNNLSSFSDIKHVTISGQAVTQTLFYGDSARLWTVGATPPADSGYVAGTNIYKDLGKYQRFDFVGSGKLIQANLYFAYKQIIGTADNFNLVVRSVGNNGEPGTLLYSKSYSVDVIDVSNAGTIYNAFAVESDVTVNGQFFIGIEWDNSVDDQFALICDADGEGQGAKRAWEKWSNNTYHDMYSAWSNFDVDIWIAALVTTTTDVKLLSDNIPTGYELYQNYPNPFNPITKIKYSLPKQEHVTLRIYDLLGNEIKTLVDQIHNPGIYEVEFNSTINKGSLSSGVYFYRLQAGNYVATKKFMLIK
ncbi:CARDB domain-containing protein [Melioribacteraceae bacterium 4301-Me]|uniref:CARDB domain-containing protein n=1 Tax=Pyranulibacter aquaticus TaxID=3163344 RepID=UPI00359BE204